MFQSGSLPHQSVDRTENWAKQIDRDEAKLSGVAVLLVNGPFQPVGRHTLHMVQPKDVRS